MKALFLIALCSLPVLATDAVSFFDIEVAHEDGKIIVTTQPQKLVDYSLLKDDDYNLNKGNMDYLMDAPFRQTAFLLRTLERNRGTLIKENKALPVLSFEFELTLRDVTGDPIHTVPYKVVIGLDAESGYGLVNVENSDVNYRFPIATLDEPDDYAKFVNHAAFPFEKRVFDEPDTPAYLIDLYYQFPEVVADKSVNVFDLFPTLLTWGKGLVKKVQIHLGTTFVRRKGDSWKHVSSAHARMSRDAIEQYTKILALIKSGDNYEIIPALEEYVDRVPGDKKALKTLMDFYLEDQRNAEAFNLISRFQPLFATIRGGLPNQKALAAKAERRRNWLLGRKSDFEKNEAVILEITSPVAGDLVTGTTDLAFSLAGNDSNVLDIECYIGEQLISKISEPPFKVPFTVDGFYGTRPLRVVAYFEDETFQETSIDVRTMKVDAQASVQLVGVRASVFQTGLSDKELTRDSFRIKENGELKEIENFRKDTAPLRVALLIDTSSSMQEGKLHQAQYAVRTFLSKLGPEDRVSLYTFDAQVLKVSDFTNKYEDLADRAMTLTMQNATALYDAMLIAHDALMGQNGTKVMIVVSDGSDTYSSTTDLHVANVIRNSPVLVYSAILPDKPFRDSGQGAEFLRKMANLSGSISKRLNNVRNLSATFDRLYEDLKSFYYMDYYSNIRDRDAREVKVSIKGARGKVRSRELN